MRRVACLFALWFCLGLAVSGETHEPGPATLHWRSWSQDVFTEAKTEHRFVLLDLEAIWCHWCHVMDVTTYRDPKVVNLLQSKYLVVKVDQDSRPDLSNRYEDYGWPATVVFDGDGHEIVKRQGYLDPEEMASMLQAIIDDPSPGPSVTAETTIKFPVNPLLSDALREQLNKDYIGGFDTKEGSWGFNQKYLDWDSVEYAMDQAAKGDANADKMARQTLKAQLNLLDPAWGGVYQYSTDGVWSNPHFEKIMQMQAENLRIYSLAYAQWHDPEYLHAAQAIHRFLQTFLMSPDGAFYTSQDADLVHGEHSAEFFKLDDQDRRKRGVPHVDTHIYARENGWAIAALGSLYAATGDTKALAEAVRATQWVQRNRALPGGGFRHGAKDVSGPFLGDSIAMDRAFLALYSVTGDRKWLADAESTMVFINKTFMDRGKPGFVTAVAPTDRAYVPHPQRDENVAVARAANMLSYYTGNSAYRKVSVSAMRYLAAPQVAGRLPAASVLLADFEVSQPPLHLTVVGQKDDPVAQALFSQALQYPSSYKRLEWWDAREGKLPNPDVQYPELAKAAAFVCTDRACSQPIFKAEDVQVKIRKILGTGASASRVIIQNRATSSEGLLKVGHQE